MGLRGETGAVTFIQRFGGALNTNPHLHSIVPDGLFVPDADGRLKFVPLPPPNDEEVASLTGLVAARLSAIAEQYCKDRDGIRPDNDDEVSMLRAASREAQIVPLAGEHAAATAVQKTKPLCGKVDGFTLHAARVVKAKDREGLERLCRYGLRAPFALERFSVEPDGKILYRCGAPMIVVALLTDPTVVSKILDHLKLPSAPPELAPPALVDEGPVILEYDYAVNDAVWCETEESAAAARGPP